MCPNNIVNGPLNPHHMVTPHENNQNAIFVAPGSQHLVAETGTVRNI